jgi:hypothetical protein
VRRIRWSTARREIESRMAAWGACSRFERITGRPIDSFLSALTLFARCWINVTRPASPTAQDASTGARAATTAWALSDHGKNFPYSRNYLNWVRSCAVNGHLASQQSCNVNWCLSLNALRYGLLLLGVIASEYSGHRTSITASIVRHRRLHHGRDYVPEPHTTVT